MAAINDLVAQIRDDALRQQIEAELKRVMKHKKFGLVFEDHLPEGVNEGPIYPGLEVVDWITGDADGSSAPTDCGRAVRTPGDTPWHALIEADNYYALQLLAYLYPGKVDCIYIDPPYNTGARDWKYNNDYVDTADQYRHSKWLSMMKRRLLVAKRLLNPKDSVLIVTIDEKEYLHLGCLLEELFPEARMQMVSTMINSGGVARNQQFSRTDEYIFFIEFGDAAPCALALEDEWTSKADERMNKLFWRILIRVGSNDTRTHSPGCFYPIYVSKDGKKIIAIGEAIPLNQERTSVPEREDAKAIWPLHKDGSEGCWQLSPQKLRESIANGYVRLGAFNERGMTINYLNRKEIEKITSGEIKVIGHREDNSVITDDSSYIRKSVPGTQWRITSHNAMVGGTTVLKNIFQDTKRFSFPKSLYAVHDAIRFFVANKPDALIVDFFAGSGTTLHAVNLLNAEDGGHRRCIMVTNNEVSAEEAKTLTKQGFKPGDEQWERLGIARYVCWPRTVCSIRGVDVNGAPLKGEYLGAQAARLQRSTADEPSATTAGEDTRAPGEACEPRALRQADGFDSNCIYFKLRFLDKDNVALGKQFRELLPLLWLRSGAKGMCPGTSGTQTARLRQSTADESVSASASPVIPDMLILPENGFAVLNEAKAFADFLQQVQEHESIRDIYLIVDSASMYREMAKALAAAMSSRHLTTCQLYRDYLDNFRINNPR